MYIEIKKLHFIVFSVFLSNSFSHHIHVTYQICNGLSTCVDISQCPLYFNYFAANYPGKIIRVPKRQSCGPQLKGSRMICCPNSSPISTREETNPIESAFGKTPEHPENVVIMGNYTFLPMEICGLISTATRIMSGEKTHPGEFPWMALLAYKTDQKSITVFRCGATILNERFVLTAAHCIDPTLVGVRLGEHNIGTEKDCDSRGENCQPAAQDFHIDTITSHPGYNSSTYVNDIALIKLSTPANFSYSNMKPICLPLGNLNSFNLTGKNVTVSGWGGTNKESMSSTLRKVELPVMSFENCSKLYEKIKPVRKTQICAGAYHGHDSCAGDSGGPLKYTNFINGTLRYIQYGIVSYGPKICGIDELPGVYTDIRSYTDWILAIIKAETM